MIFNKFTAQQLASLINNKTDFDFIVPITEIQSIQPKLTLNIKTLIPLGGVTTQILASILMSGNSTKVNLNVVLCFTSYQEGKVYFTQINTTDCKVEIEY